MFCKNCGNEVKDETKFCDKCGSCISNEENTAASSANVPAFASMDSGDKTNYAGTAFWCSVAGIPLFFCGIGLAFGIPATIFGGLAIKNKEPDKAKAWIGLILGIIELIGLLGLIHAMIRDA